MRKLLSKSGFTVILLAALCMAATVTAFGSVIFSPVFTAAITVFDNEQETQEKVSSPGTTGKPLNVDALSLAVEEAVTGKKHSVSYPATINEFYTSRDYAPVWFDSTGLSFAAFDMLEMALDSYNEGLDPEYYHASELNELLSKITADTRSGVELDPAITSQAEILLTDSFLSLAHDYAYGRISSRELKYSWEFKEDEIDLKQLLSGITEEGGVSATLRGLLPSHYFYEGLRDALTIYRDFKKAGGWKVKIPEGETMRPGETDPRVPLLRQRLRAEGYYTDPPEEKDYDENAPRLPVIDDSGVPNPDLTMLIPDMDQSNLPNMKEALQVFYFDDYLSNALKEYQKHRGLYVDGELGKNSTKSLNVTAGERVRQIELTMEFWRMMPRYLGERYIQVNVPGFEVYALEEEKPVLRMNVIAGRHDRPTPIFNKQMTHIIFAPEWNVPTKIAIEDKLPKIKKDPDFLKKHGMTVIRDGQTVDPTTIEWDTVDKKNIDFYLRQRSGSANALGPVKFMFPNKHDVYMHGTPSVSLFARSVRAFSSGCIRLERPLDMALYLLRDKPEWTREKMEQTIKINRTKTINMDEPVMVYILYYTAWKEKEAPVDFRDDIYGRFKDMDRVLASVEKTRTPTVASSTKSGN